MEKILAALLDRFMACLPWLIPQFCSFLDLQACSGCPSCMALLSHDRSSPSLLSLFKAAQAVLAVSWQLLNVILSTPAMTLFGAGSAGSLQAHMKVSLGANEKLTN